MFVGKIPTGVTDDLIERLLKACGSLVMWKRSTAANGEPKSFGFAEFE